MGHTQTFALMNICVCCHKGFQLFSMLNKICLMPFVCCIYVRGVHVTVTVDEGVCLVYSGLEYASLNIC